MKKICLSFIMILFSMHSLAASWQYMTCVDLQQGRKINDVYIKTNQWSYGEWKDHEILTVYGIKKRKSFILIEINIMN